MSKDKQNKCKQEEQLSEDFLAAVKKKDLLEMIRVKKKIDHENQKREKK